MKKLVLTLSVLAIMVTIISCNGGAQNDAKNLASQIQTTIKETAPGSIPTTAAGLTMRAKIDGKEWQANAMMPVTDRTGRIVGYHDKDYISLIYNRKDLVQGKKIKISSVDFVNHDNGICGGGDGEMTITKVDSDWVEGTFFFTVNHCSDEKGKTNIKVTDGFFRFPLEK
ncbi:MAG: hypothetical protein P0Y49_13540 [Candidatus Pedobacter colombiensis]|uniref:Lipoprotein n=1 Tax=Candidatus Pedobacter colombiensis TaxID=3121371 RepID=A0AAJ6B4P1_9SPHI|nr:DUF6252 family protein [Pedobacter sp.]WEK17822.1 MAG: hypothetical protein P0Y49_13540 [Pedobacter sp.]